MDADGGIAQHTHEWFTAGGAHREPRRPRRWADGGHARRRHERLPAGADVLHRATWTATTATAATSPTCACSPPPCSGSCSPTTSSRSSSSGSWSASARYLLIGFWFHKPSAAAAAKKAFIVTRIGDLGLLAALLLVWTRDRHLRCRADPGMGSPAATPRARSSRCSRSASSPAPPASRAQFPLHVWLPDAMEGPTPVSALIHAATMVAAGVYLVARFFPVFEASPDAARRRRLDRRHTALIAATIALVQTDFKRVLAYSTVSQLGYMMLALGALRVRRGDLPPLHARLLQGAPLPRQRLGEPLHQHLRHAQDGRPARSHMPITFWTFVIGSLSLAGIFPLAGFWSKDEILLDAWRENRALWVIGIVGRLHDRVLHVPRHLPDLLRRVQRRRAGRPPRRGFPLPRRPGAPARISLGDDAPRSSSSRSLRSPRAGSPMTTLFKDFIEGALPEVDHAWQHVRDRHRAQLHRLSPLAGIGTRLRHLHEEVGHLGVHPCDLRAARASSSRTSTSSTASTRTSSSRTIFQRGWNRLLAAQRQVRRRWHRERQWTPRPRGQ